jgi:hypothetical protein
MLGHMMLANVLGPEMTCDEAEALRIATAYVNLRKHYPALPIDPKTMAWITLGITAISVEGPKFRAMAERKRMQRDADKVAAEAARQAPGGTVVQLDPAQRDRPMNTGWPAPNG